MNTIAQIRDWPTDAIVESIQGRVAKVYDYRTGVGKEGKSTVQNADFQDSAGGRMRMSVWDHADLMQLEGKEVVVHSSRGGNGKFGGVAVKHGSYVAKKDGKDHKAGDNVATVELSVSRLGQFQLVEVYRAQNPASGASPSTTHTQPTPAASECAKSEKKGIYGGTVGMGINQACSYLIAEGHPLDPKEVFRIASGLVKVALHMEGGNLWEPKKEPEAQPTSSEPVKDPSPF